MAAKRTKKKKVKNKTGAEVLLTELQARFDVIEGKLDALLSKTAVLSRMISTERDSDFKTRSSVTKKFPIPQDKGPRERRMHKAICAECKKECEVPFVPKADRPVYCKACYSKRRGDIGSRLLPDREELVAEIAKTLNVDMSEPSKTKASKSKKAKPKSSKTNKPKAKKTKAKK